MNQFVICVDSVAYMRCSADPETTRQDVEAMALLRSWPARVSDSDFLKQIDAFLAKLDRESKNLLLYEAIAIIDAFRYAMEGVEINDPVGRAISKAVDFVSKVAKMDGSSGTDREAHKARTRCKWIELNKRIRPDEDIFGVVVRASDRTVKVGDYLFRPHTKCDVCLECWLDTTRDWRGVEQVGLIPKHAYCNHCAVCERTRLMH